MNAIPSIQRTGELCDSPTPARRASVRESRRLRTDLRASCEEGIAFGGMVGMGETYFAAFALTLGLGEISSGLVASVPLVAGGILQLASPLLIRRLGSHKTWVVLCAVAQACSFLPLVLAAVSGLISTPWMLMVVSFYWAAGLATGPAWNTWIGTIVPQRKRAKYFASRTRWNKAAVFAGFLAGGIALQLATDNDLVRHTFVILFAAAGTCRLVSAWCLSRQSEPIPMPTRPEQRSYAELVRKLGRENSGRLLLYLVAVQASVQLASPYFTPFMLKRLNFSYGEFVLLLSASFLAKVYSLSAWGQLAKRLGALRLLWIGGIGIIPMSSGWLVSQNIVWLVFLQLAAGAVWAAFELAYSLMFLDSIPDEDRTEMLTLYNLVNTIAWVGGALVGGGILYYWEASVSGYLILFAGSSALRAGCLLLLIRIQNVPLNLEKPHSSTRSVAVRLNATSLETPLLPGNKSE